MPSALITIPSITLTGINGLTPIQISEGQVSINGGAFTSEIQMIRDRDSFRFNLDAPENYSSETIVELSVGSFVVSFSVTTVDLDDVPDDFEFPSVLGVRLEHQQLSEAYIVTGINTSIPITVSGGEYSINGGEFTSSPGVVENNQGVLLRIDSPSAFGETKNMVLEIGNISYGFSITTVFQDVSPVEFGFDAENNQPLSQAIESTGVEIQGITGGVRIIIEGGEYAIGESSFTSEPGIITNNSSVRVRVMSADDFNSLREAIVTVGESSAIFSVTTLPRDLTPNTFTINPAVNQIRSDFALSDTVMVSGLSTGDVPISITNGEYRIGDGDFTSDPGTIAGASLVLRGATSESFGEMTAVTVTVGSYSTSFSMTTVEQDVEPDILSFEDRFNIPPNAWAQSAAVMVSGIDGDVPISVTDGEYRIGRGDFTRMPGTVSAGQSITLRHQTPLEENTYSATTVTVGSETGEFSSRTIENYFNSSPLIQGLLDSGTVIPNHPNSLGARIRAIKSGDIDGDGDVDLFIAYFTLSGDQGIEGIAWLENDGGDSPQFEAHWIASGRDPSEMHIVDMDGDGDADLLLREYGVPALVWYENDGAENIEFIERDIPESAGYSMTQIRVTDIDGDSLPDIVFLSYRNDETFGRRSDLFALINSEGVNFSELELMVIDSVYLDHFSVGDIDHDADMDLVAFDITSEIYVIKNDGKPVPEFSAEFLESEKHSQFHFSYIEMGLINADEHTDVVITDEAGERLYTFIGDGVGGFIQSRREVYSVDEARYVEIVDVDQDGDGDFITSSFKQSRLVGERDYLSVYENTGSYGEPETILSTRHDRAYDHGWFRVHAADLNGDGVVELVTDRGNEPRSSDDGRPSLVWYSLDDRTFDVSEGSVSTHNLTNFIYDPNGNLLEFSLSGGPDEQHFSITLEGVLTFESPVTDDNSNYKVWVAANDGFSIARFLISINTTAP